MIYCRTGWAKLVYEDQGEPFLLKAGDCVLQPPEIRHRVLEASAGLEVIEIGCPAIHETFADHNMPLPTGRILPARLYGDQRFVRHIAANASWHSWRLPGFMARDIGIAAATDGLAGVRVIRADGPSHAAASAHNGELLFLFVLEGTLRIESVKFGHHQLQAGDSVVIPAGVPYVLAAEAGTEILDVSLPADLPNA
jgi:quercetin dioxygenase-like cupin family protein